MTDHSTNAENDQAQMDQSATTESGELGNPQQQSGFESREAFSLPPELTQAQLDARQSEIGETRRPAGPALEDDAEEALETIPSDSDVEPTEVGEMPES